MLRREGIELLLGAHVTDVPPAADGVVASVVVSGGASRELRAEKLLIATGRVANSQDLSRDRAGVVTGANGAVVIDYLRTSVPHIFAAGEVVGSAFDNQIATPVVSHDGVIAAHNALAADPPRRVDHRGVPRAIFVDPPIPVVGMTYGRRSTTPPRGSRALARLPR